MRKTTTSKAVRISENHLERRIQNSFPRTRIFTHYNNNRSKLVILLIKNMNPVFRHSILRYRQHLVTTRLFQFSTKIIPSANGNTDCSRRQKNQGRDSYDAEGKKLQTPSLFSNLEFDTSACFYIFILGLFQGFFLFFLCGKDRTKRGSRTIQSSLSSSNEECCRILSEISLEANKI